MAMLNNQMVNNIPIISDLWGLNFDPSQNVVPWRHAAAAWFLHFTQRSRQRVAWDRSSNFSRSPRQCDVFAQIISRRLPKISANGH